MERQSVTMKQRPETERPYEKCLKAGAESLTDGELLAVLSVVERRTTRH